MKQFSLETAKVLKIYLELVQFPILADEIRQRMRDELYQRGMITPAELEQEVEEKATQSQVREGITNPYTQETHETWVERTQKIRDYLTDFYFAHNLPYALFEKVVRAVLQKQPTPPGATLAFNPELAPWAMLFDKANEYEKLPPPERAHFAHHLQEMQVVITKGLISDHLRFIGISRQYLNFKDLKHLVNHRIGRGKIGGKAAGMYLAYKILTTSQPNDPLDLRRYVNLPASYYIGADVFYDFLSKNNLYVYMNQKYRPIEEFTTDYEQITQAYLQGQFPQQVSRQLQDILAQLKGQPVIVRSSSLLEDRFGTSFVGKYDSFFCPNQGNDAENLRNLLHAIKQVYASTLNPAALLYRKNKGLLDYDERMAVLIQEVVGTRYKNYFFPMVAGVAFSRNPYRWSQRIDPQAGFLRLVWGLGTRAVDRVAGDYPRMLALSHPTLRPESGRKEITRYSQHYVDLIDLTANTTKTLPVTEVIGDDYPAIQHLVSLDTGDDVQPVISQGQKLPPAKMVLTFDHLLKHTNFVPLMKAILHKLEHVYETPVDIEFALDIAPAYPRAEVKIYLLQCRTLNENILMTPVTYPTHVPQTDILFTTHQWTPGGQVSNIKHIIYVNPVVYVQTDYQTKIQLGRAIGRLNQLLPAKSFILLGPGRWGSSNIDLGVKVTYADIYNTAILGEIAIAQGRETPEVSYGTHFFQDLVEARIFPLPIYPGVNGSLFNDHFLNAAANSLADLLPAEAALGDYIKVIDVPAVSQGKVLEVVMDGEHEQAIGYLKFPE